MEINYVSQEELTAVEEFLDGITPIDNRTIDDPVILRDEKGTTRYVIPKDIWDTFLNWRKNGG